MKALAGYMIMLAFCVAIAGCTSSGSKKSLFEADARAVADSCATVLIGASESDSLELEKAVLSVGAERSKFVMQDDEVAVAAFDEVLSSRLMTDRPDLYRAIFEN